MRNPFRRTPRGVALAGALFAVVGLVAVPAMATGTSAAPKADGPAVPQLDWKPCDTGFSCATATVPLDYAQPTGATIQLALIKHPATDPTHRIGTMFYNPGGPGGAGTSALPVAYGQFSAAVRARFDVVSWDPRGIGKSTPVQCFDTIDQENQLLSTLPTGYPFTYPTGAAEQRQWEQTFATIDKACAARGGPLLEHDSQADSARDLDLLRQAVGDPTLNFYGLSAGSIIGAIYANLFPTKVRAITLDGVTDPAAWYGTDSRSSRLSTYLREGSDVAFGVELNAFLDQCGSLPVSSCAFSAGSPAATHAKFTTLLNRLDSHPITGPGGTINSALIGGSAVISLGEAETIPGFARGWTGAAADLQSVWDLTTGGSASAAAVSPTRGLSAAKGLALPGVAAPADAPGSYQGVEAALAVTCSDSPNPRTVATYPRQATLAKARSGVIGPWWVWTAEACAQWPVLSADRYTGPWNHPTAAPILLVGNTFDPNTPYPGAVAMSHDLANARLLTVSGYGHTEINNPSSCAKSIEGDYFVNGTLPAPGTVCKQDKAPFAP